MTAVLGLDLALASTGWAVVDYDTADLLAHGRIVTKPPPSHWPDERKSERLSERLHEIVVATKRLIEDWLPIEIGVEQPISHNSGTTTLRIGMVHGAVRGALMGAGAIPAELGPTAVKRHATGHGNADKAAMQARARLRWGVDLTEDEADAAWVADLARARAWAEFDGGAA